MSVSQTDAWLRRVCAANPNRPKVGRVERYHNRVIAYDTDGYPTFICSPSFYRSLKKLAS